VEIDLSVAMLIHIIAGTLAALVIFPIQILGTKGTWHHRLGRVALMLAWVIAISGFAMLANPLFLSFWNANAAELSTSSMNYGTYFAYMTYEPLFFLYRDVILLYLVITGIGVWKRLERRRPDGSIPPRPMDIFWNALMALAAIAQMTLGVIDLQTDSGYAHSALHVGVIMLALVFWDVWTWRDGGRHIRSWWTVHAGKLIVAWGGLFFAVILRWQVQDKILERNEAYIVLGWSVLIVATLGTFGWLQHRRRVQRAHQ
jgi:hypothetical protein